MTWLVRQVDPEVPEHRCSPPMLDVMVRLPKMGLSPVRDEPPEPPVKVGVRPDGRVGDVWSCEWCPAVWRVALPVHLGGRTPGGGYSPRGYDRWVRLSRRQARRAWKRALT